MPLAIVETGRFHAREAVERPCQARRGILPAGEENQSCFALHHARFLSGNRAPIQYP
jgi:hypothetical protein